MASTHLGKSVGPGGFGQKQAGIGAFPCQSGDVARRGIQQSSQIGTRVNVNMPVDGRDPFHFVLPCPMPVAFIIMFGRRKDQLHSIR